MIPVGMLATDTDAVGSISYYSGLNNNQLEANENSFSLNNQNIGGASFDRMVVVVLNLAAGSFGGTVSITGVTCNGAAMTPIRTPSASTTSDGNIFYLLVPAGSTANFVFTFNNYQSLRAFQYSVYTVKGYSGAAPAVVNGDANASANYTLVAGDSIISGASARAPTSGTFNVGSMGLNVDKNNSFQVGSEGQYDIFMSSRLSNSAGGQTRVTPSNMIEADSQRRFYAVWRHT
jgi:hypothetical protein